MSLSTTIKAVQDVMRKDAGVDGDAQRIGQLGWMLFLKIFSDLEIETELEDDSYVSPVPSNLRWDAWANEDTAGTDAPTGDELLAFVDNVLFPAFKDLNVAEFTGKARQRAELLRSVFDDAYNYMKSGTLMRQVINKISHEIDFNASKTRHLFGDLYEQILRDLQSAGNAGEFYTPRAVTQFAVDMVAPRLGEIVLDPACGTGGFLTGAIELMRSEATTPSDLTKIKTCIRGVEKKALPHLLCITNMMVHGVEVPSIRHGNTLARPLRDYGPKDQVDVIVTNPPFGGMEEDGIETNFPTEFRTRETADLFLVLVMELLKDGGRAAIVLPDGTLFGEGIKTKIKRRLIEECNLHTIVRLPKGVFAPYTTIKTNVLFFTKGVPTEEIWFYEHPYPKGYKSYSKTKPIQIEEFEPEKAWWNSREETDHAWKVSVGEIVAGGYNLDIPNPKVAQADYEEPAALLAKYFEKVSDFEFAREELRAALAEPLSEPMGRPEPLLDNFDVIADAPGGLLALRELVVDLAVKARLVGQEPTDVPTADLLKEISDGGLVRSSADLLPIEAEAMAWTLPPSWKWVRLKQIVDFAPGKTPPTKDSSFWADGDGIPWVTIGDMPEGGEVWETARTVTEKAANEIFKYLPHPAGTILMSFKLTIGKMARLAVPAFHNEAIISIDGPFEETKEYLFRTLPLLAMRGTHKAAIKGNTLNKTSLTNLLIPLPPLSEQRRIVAKVDELMSLCDELERLREERELASARFLGSALHSTTERS